MITAGAAAAVAMITPAAQAEKMFVPNYTGDSISVVDTKSHAVLHTIPRSGGPWEAAVTANGRTAVIVDYNTNQLVLVNVATDRAGASIQLPGGTGADPYQVAVAPRGHMAYVVEHDTHTLVPVNLSTRTAGTPITVGADPYSLAITPNGRTAYVASYGTSAVDPVKLATGTLGTPIPLFAATWTGISPNGKTLYVVDYSGRALVPVRTSNDTVGTAIHLSSSSEPWGVVISPNGGMAYVNDYLGDVVFPIDLGTRAVGTGITVGPQSYYPTLTPDGRTLFIGNSDHSSNSLSVVHTMTLTAGSPITVGAEPGQVGIVPDQGPKAKFSHRTMGSKVKFNASKSSDSQQSITKYKWNFGDGRKAITTKPRVTHRYKHAGKHKVTLTEVDSAGCSTGLVYNGQDVYCNGGKAARVTHKVRTA